MAKAGCGPFVISHPTLFTKSGDETSLEALKLLHESGLDFHVVADAPEELMETFPVLMYCSGHYEGVNAIQDAITYIQNSLKVAV